LASETARYVDRLTRDHIGPLLRARGFRRKGRTWNRPGDGLVQVVNVQGSALSFGGLGGFYINLGIFVPGLAWDGVRGEAGPFITEGRCQLHVRLGQLRPDHKDIWDFVVSDDIEALGRSVADALIAHGLPFLDQCGSPKELDEFLGANDLRFHFHAALTAYRGQREAARGILLRASEENASYRRAAQWAADMLGINLGPAIETAKLTDDK
jgi:hypothetical protein